MKVCILSSVHIALDNRVFYREARSLQSAGYDVTLIAIHPKNELKDGVQIIGLPRVARWRRPLLWRKVYQLARQSGADIFQFPPNGTCRNPRRTTFRSRTGSAKEKIVCQHSIVQMVLR